MNPAKLLLVLLAIAAELPAQNFQRAYGRAGSETGTAIKTTSGNNFIISAYTTSFGSGNEGYLLKIDTAGNLLWSKTYGGSGDDIFYYVNTCSDGGFIATGGTTSFGSGGHDMYLVRTDSAGNLLWSKAIGGSSDDYGWYVLQANDGGFIVSGFTMSYGSGSWDGYLVKTDSSGTVQWTKTFGDTGTDDLYGIIKTADGGYAITGSSTSNSFGASDTWLIKTNSAGDTLWTRQYGGSMEESGNALIQTPDGGFMITGDIHNLQNIHHASLLKTDSLGNIQWATTYGGNWGEFGWDVKREGQGYLLIGATPSYGNGKQVFLVRTDSTGNIIWSKVYGGTDLDDSWLAVQTAGGGLVIVGATLSFGAGQWDVYAFGIDSAGVSSCNEQAVVPGKYVPPLSVRRGIPLGSGGVQTNAATIVNTVVTDTADACLGQGVDELKTALSASVFPNPFSGYATLHIENYNDLYPGKTYLEITDVFGRKIRQMSIREANTEIKQEELSPGIYFYHLVSCPGREEKIISSGKFVIN